jgi:cell division protein FtsI (penicillin-binding protein 3)
VKNLTRSRRRLVIAIALILAVVSVFIVRLVDIQVVRADVLNKASMEKRSAITTTYAPRGTIVDTNGTVLADSVMRYNITASPKALVEVLKAPFNRTVDGKKVQVTLLEAAGEIATLTGQDANDVYANMTKNPTANFVYLAKKVDTATLRAVRALKIPGVSDERQPVRTYPEGAVAGNLVGFVGTDGPQNGLEKLEDKCLAGVDGKSSYEQGLDGVQIPGSIVTTKTAVPGGTLKTTIDHDLQWYAQQAIAEQGAAIGAVSATAIVVRIKDAHLMAVADWPSVDPNNVNATLDNLGSLAFTAEYEPGSVFKGMSAAILIDTGKATPLTQATVPWSWKTPEGGSVHDAGAHATEQLTLTGVLQQSSNVGISMIGSKVSPQVRYDYMRKFGLLERTAVDFQGERSGSLANWQNWDAQTKYNVLYGQGVSATALQVAGIYQTLGNNGVRLPLTLVEGCTRADGTVTDLPSTKGTQVVSASSAKTVVNMLESVVDGGELSKAVKIPGYRVAGKSGTAEVAENGRYGANRIVSFVGLAPAEDPQYEVLVTYTKPVTIKTSAAAAPTFKKIMTQVLSKYRVPPSTSPSQYPATTW